MPSRRSVMSTLWPIALVGNFAPRRNAPATVRKCHSTRFYRDIVATSACSCDLARTMLYAGRNQFASRSSHHEISPKHPTAWRHIQRAALVVPDGPPLGRIDFASGLCRPVLAVNATFFILAVFAVANLSFMALLVFAGGGRESRDTTAATAATADDSAADLPSVVAAERGLTFVALPAHARADELFRELFCAPELLPRHPRRRTLSAWFPKAVYCPLWPKGTAIV